MTDEALRRIFRLLNRFFMVPVFRAGLGPLIGNPLSGYIMVMKMKGWKSGLERYVPVNYAIHNGSVYCLAGFGRSAHWYRNLITNPQVELILPAGKFSGTAEAINDELEKRVVTRQVLKNSGFAGFIAGYNPYTITDPELAARTADYILFRIRLNGLSAGPADPGGWLWIIIWGGLIAWLLGLRSRKNR